MECQNCSSSRLSVDQKKGDKVEVFCHSCHDQFQADKQEYSRERKLSYPKDRGPERRYPRRSA